MATEEFSKIINDFTSDILITFPEYLGIISKWWSKTEKKTEFVFNHCVKVFPERFFDILYKSQDIFLLESTANTEFLPGIVFKQLWNCDISDATRDTIWSYLQLILFSVMASVNDTGALGDTAKLFEAINEDELRRKLETTMEEMQKMFDLNGEEANEEKEDNENKEKEGINMNAMPNAEEIHNHINTMMGGKLGKIAMELAEETAEDLNLDLDSDMSAKDVFQKLFKNPTKLMDMVKNIGTKLDDKIKSGELKESEIMEEGMELLNKMKNMPGLGNMQKMFSQMGIPGLGKGAKVNMNAMESQMQKNMNMAKMKERMKAKVEQKSMERELNAMASKAMSSSVASNSLTDEELINMFSNTNTNKNTNINNNKNTNNTKFSTGEKVERTPRGLKPNESITPNKVNNTINNKKKPKK